MPVVDLCMRGSAVGYESLGGVDVAARGRGEFVALDAATGERVWSRRLPQPVFGCATAASRESSSPRRSTEPSTPSTDEDGTTLWSAKLAAGNNACPALAGDTLLVGGGVPRPGGVLELEAFRAGSP